MYNVGSNMKYFTYAGTNNKEGQNGNRSTGFKPYQEHVHVQKNKMYTQCSTPNVRPFATGS